VRRADRAYDVRSLALSARGPLGAAPPVAGGIDVALPGDGIRLAATRWPGNGAPVVLLHGLASQRRFWNLVVPHLAGLPVVAIDQRGHGDSDRPDSEYGLDVVARDLATAMDALGIDRAVIVGHSWGGSVAATFAADYAHRSLALVAIDGGFSSPLAAGADRAEVRKALEPPRFSAPPEELLSMFSTRTPGGIPWSPELSAAVLPIFEVGDDSMARARLPFELHMRIVDSLLDYDAAAVLSRVQCPAWLVSCESVGLTDAWSQNKAAALNDLADVVPDGRFLHWAGAVHDVPLQWPALVAGLIRAAVTDRGAAEGSEP
jgi:pimeloyl-ACP methyl ester carboxylesterase